MGVSLEFSFGRINSRLQRFDTLLGGRPEAVDGTDLGIGVNVGLLWHPMKDLSFGAVYRRGPEYDMTFNDHRLGRHQLAAVRIQGSRTCTRRAPPIASSSA